MRGIRKTAYLGLVVGAVALGGCLSGGGGGSSKSPAPSPSEPLTEQQQRIRDGFFVVQTEKLPFDALNATHANSSRWHGVLDGAGYRVEVPENWNGMLVMYAHGYRGDGPELTVDSPPMREYLLDNGYAWAASSYSTNFYDVRAGVEDTNALALAFNDIAAENGRPLDEPTHYYITGVSMGGHVAGAAIERETQQTANNFVPYAGAAPMCGVMGDTALFDYFTAYSLSLYAFAGTPADSFPLTPEEAAEKLEIARDTLWADYEANPHANGLTPAGVPFLATLQNLSGGPRPIYPLSFGGFQGLLQGLAGDDGTINGVLSDSVVDTTQITYRFETAPGAPLSPAEQAFNNSIAQAVGVSGANGPRDDGLRLIPKVNGDLYADIPVVTIHTLGDLFVPISMQQIYRQRMEANGWGDNLVQRAVRAPGHCDFSLAEFVTTLDAMLQWEQNGTKPAGDDLLTPAVMADPDFGCTYTVNGPPQTVTRALMPACTAE
ncbi:alpha/beta hydrolase [Halopseudomonas pertucinogena]|uniref:Alpha/beta hydrolase n=1 Tax=Halopseudomonas pertucinogena TaxID=86175 RepID=A0ABQ2CH71_9GAMM|nr:alpha/beta hydrolase [Halopseudomonas pertucinogena]GGI89254.1 alpha/beta hydrolase [Halopseudomonas pertucinogena]